MRRRIDALEPGVRPWAIDLRAPESFTEPPAAFDTLFFTASADRRDEEAYRAIYVDALRQLLDALRRADAPLERVFFTSSTAVYGQSSGEWVDEASPTQPARFNGRILLDAERVVSDAPELGLNVRLSGIYGPGRTRLVRNVFAGEATAHGAWTNRIHIEDCAGVLHHLMRLRDPRPLYLASDDTPATMAEVVTWMSAQLDVPAPPTGDTARLNKRCRSSLLRRSGYEFAYPSFRDGYPPIIEEFLRERGA